MPRPKTSGRDRKTGDRKPRKSRQAAAGARTAGDAATSFQAQAPSDMAPDEMLIESLLCDLNKARKLAFGKGRPSAALTATLAMHRLLCLLPDRPGRPPSSLKRFPLVWQRSAASWPGKARRGRT
jgi:hypothetical protein